MLNSIPPRYNESSLALPCSYGKGTLSSFEDNFVKSSHRIPLCRLSLGILASLAAVWPVQAQAEGASTAKQTGPVAAGEVDRMNQDLADLELLRPLLPLNLTQSQIDSLVSAMKEIAAEWREVKKKDDAALKALGPDIEKVHAAALVGTPIPREFDAKILEGQKTVTARQNEARLSAVRRLVLLLSNSLTAAQKDSVEAWSVQQFGGRRIPKKYQANPSKAPKEEVQALAIAALVERTLLFDRTLTLLQQIKPVSSASGPGKDTPAPPAAPAN